jgi:hypothetical protein
MIWAPVGCRRKGDEILGWQWVGFVHGVRSAVITRERQGGLYVVYAARRYIGHYPWLKDAKEAAMFAATEVPFQVIDLVAWLLALVSDELPRPACRSRASNTAPGRLKLAPSVGA